MATERISQILPTVKCSDCGRDVLIRRLGDHLCTSQPPVPSLPIIPQAKDKFNKMGNNISKPISPLQSPNGSSYGNKKNDFYSSNATTPPPPPPAGSVTPPYYSGMARDLQRSVMKDTYTDDSYSDDFYKAPYKNSYHSNSSSSNMDLPRKNSTSPAPSSPSSYRNRNDSNPDFNTRYEGTRKQSLGNIYQQQQQSYSTPTANTYNSSSGALDNLMADLMNSMNDDIHLSATNTMPSSQNKSSHCDVCREDFDYRDDVKTTGGKCYHKTCFTCRLCSTPFDQRRTHHEYEGKLYCERDFHVVKNRIMCASCDRAIPPSVAPIKALGKFYHPGHIKCYHCYAGIDDRTGWKEYQGRVYCRQDFKSLFLPKCRACHKTVEKNAVSAMDGKLKGKWHLECFGCHTCRRPFPDNTFYVFDDAPYCKRHYHELNNSLCKRCSDPIEGYCAYTSPENWRFHPNCFTCETCYTRLDNEYYVTNGRIYCEKDIRRQYNQKNYNLTKRKTQMYNI
ncbi:paxillin-like [Mucor ambiguus]|uniref:Paxillin-like n=1 Tax=Mucor ambiguus TaxID=91626 RepID=A0A0C9ME06_9FUNG|nr:paxillin-like [Mucor ambiguus]